MINRRWLPSQVANPATPKDFDERTLRALRAELPALVVETLIDGRAVDTSSVDDDDLTHATAILALSGFVTVESPSPEDPWHTEVSVLRPSDGIPLDLIVDCVRKIGDQRIFEWLFTVVEAFDPGSAVPVVAALELAPPQPTQECPAVSEPLSDQWAAWVEISRGLIDVAYRRAPVKRAQLGLS